MSDASPYELDKWQRHNTYYYRHVETGNVIHEEAYEAKKQKHNTLQEADVTANKELRELVERWRQSEVEQPLNHAELAEKEAFETCINQLEDLITE